jgi:hypothetical protein
MRNFVALITLALALTIACGGGGKGFIPPTAETTPTPPSLSPGVIATADAALRARTPTPTATTQPTATPVASPTATPIPPDVQILGLETHIDGYDTDLTARISATLSIRNNTGARTQARIVLSAGFLPAGQPASGVIDLEPGVEPLTLELSGRAPVGSTEVSISVLPVTEPAEAIDTLRHEIEVPMPMLISLAAWEYAKETQGTETNNITWFRKWEKKDLKVFVAGTDEGVAFYWQVADQLSELTGLTFNEYAVPLESDMIVLVGLTVSRLIPLLPEERQAQATIHFQTNAAAFDWELIDDAQIIGGLAMAIGEPYSQAFTDHNILEETTQFLGPGADSPRYPDSIFYEVDGVSGTVTQLAPIDKTVISFIYDPRISAGDTFDEVESRIAFIDDMSPSLLASLIESGETVYAPEYGAGG